MKKLILGLVVFSLGACEFSLEEDKPSESTPTQLQNQTESSKAPSLRGERTIKARFKDEVYTLEIADTDETREKGLMGRVGLPENQGMIFIFDQPADHAFWMKNMHFPLDIIWLSAQKRVLHVVQAEPCTTDTCTIYRPEKGTRALYVIELAAGTFSGKIGDYIDF